MPSVLNYSSLFSFVLNQFFEILTKFLETNLYIYRNIYQFTNLETIFRFELNLETEFRSGR